MSDKIKKIFSLFVAGLFLLNGTYQPSDPCAEKQQSSESCCSTQEISCCKTTQKDPADNICDCPDMAGNENPEQPQSAATPVVENEYKIILHTPVQNPCSIAKNNTYGFIQNYSLIYKPSSDKIYKTIHALLI